MKAALFINGQPPNFFIDLAQYDLIHCTDGAINYLTQKGIKADIISGDFDSIETPKLSYTHELISTPDQDFTDFEKALAILSERGVSTVHVYGTSGKQQDHFLGNLTAAYRFFDQMTILMFGDFGYYFFAEKNLELSGYKDRTISLYPFPVAEKVHTEGLKYPLILEDLDIHKRIGIRNKVIENLVKISYEKGALLVFILNN